MCRSRRRAPVAPLLLRAGVPAVLGTEQSSLQRLGTPVKGGTVEGAGVPYTTERYIYQSNVASKDVVYYEALIESLDVRATVNGVESPVSFKGAVGQKIGFALDAAGHITRCSAPIEAARVGLIDLLFSLFSWAPAQPLAVGQSWETPTGHETFGYGYVSAAALSDVPKSAQTAYTLAALSGDLASIDGKITLRQPGATMLDVPAAKIKVNLVAAGGGTTHIEHDVKSNRVTSAVAESLVKGRVVNIAPTREGEKMQPREGALVEAAKFSVKLVP